MKVREWLDKLRGKKPIIIDTPWGPVTEAARLRAAINMRDNPQIKERVIELLSDQYGSRQAGEREARKRYPESF